MAEKWAKSFGPFKTWFSQRISSYYSVSGLFYVFSWSSGDASLTSIGVLGDVLSANTSLPYFLLLKSFGCTWYEQENLLGCSVAILTACSNIDSFPISTTFASFFQELLETFKLNKKRKSPDSFLANLIVWEKFLCTLLLKVWQFLQRH